MIVTVILLVILFITVFYPANEKRIVEHFENNKYDMENIATFLLNYDSENIYITNEKIYGVPDSEIQKLGEKLFRIIDECDLLYIEKCQQTVLFCYEAYMTNGLGMAYTSNGKKPKSKYGEMLFTKKIETGWYYCELD